MFEKKHKILGPKWDMLTKHEGKQKATFDMPRYNVKVDEWFISNDINLRMFAMH